MCIVLQFLHLHCDSLDFELRDLDDADVQQRAERPGGISNLNPVTWPIMVEKFLKNNTMLSSICLFVCFPQILVTFEKQRCHWEDSCDESQSWMCSSVTTQTHTHTLYPTCRQWVRTSWTDMRSSHKICGVKDFRFFSLHRSAFSETAQPRSKLWFHARVTPPCPPETVSPLCGETIMLREAAEACSPSEVATRVRHELTKCYICFLVPEVHFGPLTPTGSLLLFEDRDAEKHSPGASWGVFHHDGLAGFSIFPNLNKYKGTVR